MGAGCYNAPEPFLGPQTDTLTSAHCGHIRCGCSASFPRATWLQAKEEAASAFDSCLQNKLLPPLGSDATDAPLKIKPGLLPAPSGRLLISRII